MTQLLSTSGLAFRTARKTRPLKAIPVSEALPNTDPLVKSRLRIETLEGHAPVLDGAHFCLGEAGDLWIQGEDKLFKKYDPEGGKDADGWTKFVPKPENAANAVQATASLLGSKDTKFAIVGQWGETLEIDGEKVENLQVGNVGDYVLQNPTDPSDVWIVKRSLFESTYVIES